MDEVTVVYEGTTYLAQYDYDYATDTGPSVVVNRIYLKRGGPNLAVGLPRDSDLYEAICEGCWNDLTRKSQL